MGKAATNIATTNRTAVSRASKDASDEFAIRVATKPEEIKQLREVGFEFVCQEDDRRYCMLDILQIFEISYR